MTALAVVLAAGGGSRFRSSTHKLNARLGGIPIAATSIGHALAAGIGSVIVVSGAVPLVDVPAGAELIHNPRWHEGMATSLTVAIEEARARELDAVVVGLADQPFVLASDWQRVAASNSPIGVATYDGRRGNPVLLARSVWDDLPTTGDHGARLLIRLRPDLVEAVPCRGAPNDIDTVEDLQRWQSKSSTNLP